MTDNDGQLRRDQDLGGGLQQPGDDGLVSLRLSKGGHNFLVGCPAAVVTNWVREVIANRPGAEYVTVTNNPVPVPAPAGTVHSRLPRES